MRRVLERVKGMDRVDVEPELLRRARQRAGLGIDALAGRFPKLDAWERGEIRPTLKQLERFAKATFTPIGCFFLREAPVEHVPIPDFRTVANSPLHRPSASLLDTIYLCQCSEGTQTSDGGQSSGSALQGQHSGHPAAHPRRGHPDAAGVPFGLHRGARTAEIASHGRRRQLLSDPRCARQPAVRACDRSQHSGGDRRRSPSPSGSSVSGKWRPSTS